MQASPREVLPAALQDDAWLGDREDEAAIAYEASCAATEEDMVQLREDMLREQLQAEESKPDVPRWVTKMGINEREFVKDFMRHTPVCYWDGAFHGIHGVVEQEYITHQITTLILPYVSRNIEKTAHNLLGVLRLYAKIPAPTPDSTTIPVANGVLHIVETAERDPESEQTSENKVSVYLSSHMEIAPYRLPVEFHETTKRPLRWLDFLDSLLVKDDIDTLQEYLGYLLIPTTKAQKMLCIIGRGGEGKSVIGAVLKSILGDSLWFSSIQKIENNRFARADLSGKLCMVDDDMQLNALSSTGILKALVTSNGKFDVERKGRQSTQEDMYCRFLCFGNGMLTALYDRTNGFYRRQMVLRTKPKDKNRVDDPWLIERLIAEREGIFLWMVAGLIRLIEQQYRFTVSDHAKQCMRENYFENNNMEEFLRDSTRVSYGADQQITSKRLCIVYRKWCEDNGVRPVSDQFLIQWLKDNAERFSIFFKKKLREDGGEYRGFLGMSAHV